jgi:carbon-monoxide dehydrogenase medium subunit
MIAQNFEYSSPATLGEALALLADGNAKALAGGMSLIPLMKLRLAAPEHVVDLSRISELNYIREERGAIRIGATVTHHQVESSPLLRGKCPLIAETAGRIGDVQVRNMGTMGGSVAHADPAADYPAALLALEAQVRLAGSNSERILSIADFFVDTFTTALKPGEILREIVLPVEGAGAGVSYYKVVQPASGFAIVGIAARVSKASGKVSMARVGVTGLAGMAFRASGVEKLLEGTGGSAGDIRQAAAVVADGVDANTDLHASADYRRHLARVATERALTAALSRTT